MTRTRAHLAATTALVLLATLQAGHIRAQEETGDQATETVAPPAPASGTAASDTTAPATFVNPADIPPDIRAPTVQEQERMARLETAMSAALDAGNLEAAEQNLNALLDLERQTWGPDHPWTGNGYSWLARIRQAQEDHAAAFEARRQQHTIYRSRLGDKHPSTIVILATLAEDAFRAGANDEALDIARQAADLAREGALVNPEFAALRVIADISEARQDDTAAVAALERIVDLVAGELGDEHEATQSWRTREQNARMIPAYLMIREFMRLYESGDFQDAYTTAQGALAISMDVLGEDHPDTLMILNNYAVALDGIGNTRQAEPLLRDVFAKLEGKMGPNAPYTLNSIGSLATILTKLGQFEEAEQLQRRALSGYENLLGAEAPMTLRVLGNLAETLVAMGRNAEAERLHRRALSVREQVLGAEHRDTLSSLSNLAQTVESLGRIREAEAMHRLAFEKRTKVLGSRHPDTLMSKNYLASALRNLGDPKAAEPLHRSTLATIEDLLGPDHPLTLSVQEDLAGTLFDLGDYTEAEELHRHILSVRERLFGKERPETLSSMNHLGTVLLASGKPLEAEELLREAIAISERTMGYENVFKLSVMQNLADTLDALDRSDEAEPLRRTVLAAFERLIGPDHPLTLISLDGLAVTLLELGRALEAEPIIRQAWLDKIRVLGSDHPATISSLGGLGALLNETGDFVQAESLLRRAVEISDRILGPEHPSSVSHLSNLATSLLQLGRAAEAEPLLRKTLTLRERNLGIGHPDTITSAHNLATVLDNLGRPKEAEVFYRRALLSFESDNSVGSDSAHAQVTILGLAMQSLTQGRAAEAEQISRQAAEKLEEQLGAHHPDTLGARNIQAMALASLGRLSEAETIHRNVLAARQSGLGQDHPRTLDTVANLAMTLNALGNSKEALELSRRAMESSARSLGDDHPTTLDRTLAVAIVYDGLGDPLSAFPLIRRLVSARLEKLSEGSDAAEATQNKLKTEALISGAALSYLAWEISSRGLGSGPDYTPTALRSEGFSGIQVGAGGSSGSAVARSAARVAAGAAGLEDVVTAWEGAVAAREAVDRQITDAAGNTALDAASLAALRANLAAARAEAVAQIASARARLEAEFPRFFDLVSPAPVSVAELQGATGDAALLGEDEALVLLTPGWGDRPGLVWAVSREGVAWAEIGLSPGALTAKIGALHADIDKARSSNLRAPSFGGDGGAVVPDRLGVGFDRALAHELHQALFGDPAIAAVLQGKTDWILAPQGALLSVPYAALVSAVPSGAAAGRDDDPAALRATAWLGFERALTVVPSVSTVRALRRLGKAASDGPGLPFFGLGDPAFEGAPLGQRGADAATDEVHLASAESFFRGATGQIEAVRALPQLPGTRTEVEAMATAFGAGAGDMLLGAEANETRLAERSDDGSLGQARVVLFATHGLMAGGERGFAGLSEPALALSPPQGMAVLIDRDGDGAGDGPPDEADIAAAVQRGARLDDGLLTASEAARLDLDADWVILSACDTAAGSTPDAEGLSGLARAFFYAGARSLLVSHWPVEDAAAARLTTNAVTRARTDPNLTRAQAFQAAMRDLAQDTANPHYAHPALWAPFQIVGVQ